MTDQYTLGSTTLLGPVADYKVPKLSTEEISGYLQPIEDLVGAYHATG